MRPVIIIKTDAHEDDEGLLNDKVYISMTSLQEDLKSLCKVQESSESLETFIEDTNSGDYVFLEDMRFALFVMRIV